MINIIQYSFKRSFFTLSMITCLFIYTPIQAKEGLFLSGAEGGARGNKTYNYYTFAAILTPLFGNTLGDGFVQKYWIDVLGYDYPSGDHTIDAAAIGLEGALGYQVGGQKGWVAAYAGIRYSNTWLSPDNPNSKVRGSQARAKFQAEGEKKLATNWKMNAIGTYTIGSDSYWARNRELYRIYKEVYTGPEFIIQGDPDYRAWQLGWVVTGFKPVPKGNLGIKMGARKAEKSETSIYLGVEFSKLF